MTGVKLMKQIGAYAKRHLPEIFAILGSVGVVATGMLSAKASKEAEKRLNEAEIDKKEDLTNFEKFVTAAPAYAGAIFVGAVTIACVAGSQILNSQKQAAIIGAYIFLDNKFREYKKKLVELHGKEMDTEITRSILETVPRDTIPIQTKEGFCIFYEDQTETFFERTFLEVKEAEYQLNRKFAIEGEVSLNDFLYFLGLPEEELGDTLGWQQDIICDFPHPPWIDFEHELITLDDGTTFYKISYVDYPIII